MNQARITFSNNDTLIVSEHDVLIPVCSFEHDGERLASMRKPVILESHIHDGLIPSLMELLCNCDFFYPPKRNDIIYSSSSIVKIENC